MNRKHSLSEVTNKVEIQNEEEAVKHLKLEKAARIDNVTSEMLKYSG